MARRQTESYFEMFKKMGDSACQAADQMIDILKAFDPATLAAKMEALHAVEHAADKQKHQLMGFLAKDFITPIDREDIMNMVGELDEVVDEIEDIIIKIYMFNIKSIRPDALEFARILAQCCQETRNILKEFKNYKKSKTIAQSIIELNRLEEIGDALYMRAVRNLYEKGGDPLEVMAWTTVYGTMEKCCDACEHTANVVEEIILKNS